MQEIIYDNPLKKLFFLTFQESSDVVAMGKKDKNAK